MHPLKFYVGKSANPTEKLEGIAQSKWASKIKIPHKSWNNRACFNVDLNSNIRYNNQEYTNAGGQGV